VPKGSLSHRLCRTLVWIALLVFASVGANLVGIRLVGNVDAWSRWLDDHASYFFVWRLCLYGATAYGWRWMRRRLRQHDASVETRQRLLRTEIGAIAAIVLLEVSLWFR
jgi:hypothetical protein